jgi:hypothetical protein
VRNNIHMAARAGQMMDKELSLKVVVVWRQNKQKETKVNRK